ncbi:MAG: hypothetical protein GWN81_20510, partial [Phycisphaerae bacterium]|nr:hypothetical protein [Phycisphaerae bacterium]NIP54884.1 hypothetical protein [Phycisphaerae bacterium]NIU11170.1 hypothetical protein [Phycisphaerae bacterium]NIX01255.1 hypothetical protein [Phycisphaerae bacterium]NIX30935.1 hypothetical protein [Phycisphaerae bacterium]
MKKLRSVLLLLALMFAVGVRAEIPTVLTDTIKSGSGIIDVMTDVTATELEQSLSN